MITFSIITIFPEMFPGCLGASLPKKAQDFIYKLNIIDLKLFGKPPHYRVDDRPFGGEAGMVIMPDVLERAIESAIIKDKKTKLIYTSPKGKLYTQNYAKNIINYEHIIIICGRYEGIDQRVIDFYNIEEISIGDYVLSGGEIASQVIVDSAIRLIPGFLSNNQSIETESFSIKDEFDNLYLEHPQYTKPRIWKDIEVPEVLISGNHKMIKNWKMEQSKIITKTIRPDLLKS
jgi:tRNA (guanine37-N1)-methyltransferase